MPAGFFAKSTLLASKLRQSLVPKCGACGLYKLCENPKMPPSGRGKRRILVVGEAPGADEDEQGVQFVGRTGQHLRRVMSKVGIDSKRDVWFTNSLICRPPNNETPDDKKIDYCRPNLLRTIDELKPDVIILLGSVAVKSLLGSIWREDVGSISRWVGWKIPCQKINAWICPTWHPSYLLRMKEPILDRSFEKHLEAAGELEGKPFDVVPDYRKRVTNLYNPEEAASFIRDMIRRGGPIAFDYEGNMLKPDWSDWKIVSCSVCWKGKQTIAYPWVGEAIKATGELLDSELPKVASNMKLEDRWTRRYFGYPVRNWKWDTMLAAHILDVRRDITSIKFQSFVQLGQESYDDHIKPLLRTKGDNRVNQILKEVNMDELLLYNGLDSLLEYLVAKKQMKQLGVSFYDD